MNLSTKLRIRTHCKEHDVTVASSPKGNADDGRRLRQENFHDFPLEFPTESPTGLIAVIFQ